VKFLKHFGILDNINNKGFRREGVVLILSGNRYSENFVNDNQKSPALLHKAGKIKLYKQQSQ